MPSSPRDPAPDPDFAESHAVFDIVGKRRWFFLLSLLVTIPGLFFILLTPLTNGAAGLKFSIDYSNEVQVAGLEP